VQLTFDVYFLTLITTPPLSFHPSSMPPPFYSPNLALQCEGNECSTINWGQQAHVPTIHDSPLLYYTRYRDCGDGIIEYDMAMYHFGKVATDIFTYFNTPWTGVRTSTFRDMMISNVNGVLEHHFPMASFEGNNIRDLETTGGFTTFTEDLQLSSDLYDFGFCVDTTKVLPDVANTACDPTNPNIVPFVFQVQEGGANAIQNGLSEPYGLNYTISANLCNLEAPVRLGSNGWGNPYDGVLLTNDRSGFSLKSNYIIHFCWEDKKTYFDINVTAEVFNQQFLEGDTISIKYITSGKRIEDQLAMTFVHGTNPEYPASFYAAKSRERFGTTTCRRDGTVWTTNFLGYLEPSQTYLSRKYMITDSLQNMEATASNWVDGGAYFGATIGSDFCGNPLATLACTGSSTPKSGFNTPWFYVTCGSARVTTSDPYYFAVFEKDDTLTTTDNKKPYLCVGESNFTRPSWKILGYFGTDCNDIGGKEYQSNFCPDVATMIPSQAPVSSLAPYTDAPFAQTDAPFGETGSPLPISAPYMNHTSEVPGSPSKVPTTDVPSLPISAQNMTDTPEVTESPFGIPSTVVPSPLLSSAIKDSVSPTGMPMSSFNATPTVSPSQSNHTDDPSLMPSSLSSSTTPMASSSPSLLNFSSILLLVLSGGFTNGIYHVAISRWL
jgi:hypothetical protein